MKKVLVTGFDPFGGEKINPALEVIKLLPKEIKGTKIVTLEVPTVFKKSHQVLFETIEKEAPDMVISIGQAGGRYDITLERVAINLDDARIEDNEKNQPIDEIIYEDGATAYFSTLPIKAMVQSMRETKIPASVSNSAGTFVCNHLMYGALYYAAKHHPHMRAGFIHIPYLFEQVVNRPNTPAMGLQEILKGLIAGIEAAIEYDKDILVQGGSIC